MKVGDHIFVYGTLRPGRGANRYMQEGATHIGPDRINGRMFSMGGFPGVSLVGCDHFDPEKPTIEGDVYRLDEDDLSSKLDRYEGYPFLYDRKQVESESGETVWVYEINDPPEEKYLIPSGVWGAT